MPLTFSGVIAEHRAVRERAGLFDVSHLGKVEVTGGAAGSLLERLLPGPVESLEDGQARYNLLLTEDGGIVDDLFVYRRPGSFVVVPNAANTPAVVDALRAASSGDVRIEDGRERWAIIALQGPRAREIAEQVMPGANALRLHRFADFEITGSGVQVARTGYTGEYGFELFVESERSVAVWRMLLEAGAAFDILPAGLGARDTLRLEMAYPLHGQDIGPDTNPVEAGLGWVVDWNKPVFRGRDRVLRMREEGPHRRLVGMLAGGPGIPRHGHPILHDGTHVGKVASGNISPVLGKGVALAYVPTELASPGTILSVDVRGKHLPMEVVKPPFIRPATGRG